MHKLDLTAILSTIVGVSSLATDAAFSAQIGHAVGPKGPLVVAILGITGMVASQVLRSIGSPSTSTATKAAVDTITAIYAPPQAVKGP